jgi:hypothetical protein
VPREDEREERRVADEREAALGGEIDGTGHELAGGDADADGHRLGDVALRRELLVDRARGADGVQDAALAAEDADEAVTDDLAHDAVLADDLRLLDAHRAADDVDDARGIAAADRRRQAAQIGHEDRPLIERRRLLRPDRNGFAFFRARGHLLVQLLELGLVAQRRDHLGERAPEDAHLVGAVDGRVDVVVAGRDRLRESGQLLDRTRHALGDDPREDEREQ